MSLNFELPGKIIIDFAAGIWLDSSGPVNKIRVKKGEKCKVLTITDEELKNPKFLEEKINEIVKNLDK